MNRCGCRWKSVHLPSYSRRDGGTRFGFNYSAVTLERLLGGCCTPVMQTPSRSPGMGYTQRGDGTGTHHTGFSLKGSLLLAVRKHHFASLLWRFLLAINVLTCTSSLPPFQRANESRSRIKLGKECDSGRNEKQLPYEGHFSGFCFFFWCSTSSCCQSYNSSKIMQEPSTTIILQ